MADMIEKKRIAGLGRGLSALMEEIGPSIAPNAAQTPVADGGAAVRPATLPVSRLRPNPRQPRRRFDETAMAELIESVKLRGVLQPLLVRPRGEGYEIVAGERRWRAAQAAQLHEVPVVIKELDDSATYEIALIENIQRADLNAIEEADGYRRLIDEFGHTQDALARLVGKSRSHIANLLRLLDLPGSVREMLIDGRLSMGHARAVLTSPDPIGLAKKAVAQGLSVRQVEALAAEDSGRKKPRSAVAPLASSSDADVRALEQQLSEALGLKVSVVHEGGGGTVSIRYASLDQLDLVSQRLIGLPAF